MGVGGELLCPRLGEGGSFLRWVGDSRARVSFEDLVDGFDCEGNF